MSPLLLLLGLALSTVLAAGIVEPADGDADDSDAPPAEPDPGNGGSEDEDDDTGDDTGDDTVDDTGDDTVDDTGDDTVDAAIAAYLDDIANDPAAFVISGPGPVTGTPDGDRFVSAEPGVNRSTGEVFSTIGGTTIDAGAGDDTLQGAALGVLFDGGDGDDVVGNAFDDEGRNSFWGSTIRGGADDDVINLGANNEEQARAFGGDGDDTLAGSASVDLYGEAGDDLLISEGHTDTAAGYRMLLDGGDGDDTIRIATWSADPAFDEAITVVGGAGADLFAYTLSEDDPDAPDDTLSANGPGPHAVGRIDDFEPGVDRLQIEIDALGDGYVLTDVTLDRGETTELRLLFEALDDAEPDQTMVFALGTAAVTFDDIDFVGDEQPATRAFA